MGNGDLWSVHSSSSLQLLPTHTFHLLQVSAFHRQHLPSGSTTCPGVGLSTGCSVDICSDVVLCVLQGFLVSPLPPPPLTWVLAELFLTFLSSLPCVVSHSILITFSQRHQQPGSWLWCVMQRVHGPGWSCPCSAQPLLTEASTLLQTPSAPGFYQLCKELKEFWSRNEGFCYVYGTWV